MSHTPAGLVANLYRLQAEFGRCHRLHRRNQHGQILGIAARHDGVDCNKSLRLPLQCRGEWSRRIYLLPGTCHATCALHA